MVACPLIVIPTKPTSPYKPIIQTVARSGNYSTGSVYLPFLILGYSEITNKVVHLVKGEKV